MVGNVYIGFFVLCVVGVCCLLDGFVAYRRREFCNDVKCSVQVELNGLVEGSVEYERVRRVCVGGCLFSTYQFHHWLIDKGYLIVRPVEEG